MDTHSPNSLDLNRVQATRRGDLQAFNDLVLAHQNHVFWWVFQLVGDRELAQDLTQSVLLTAYQKLDTFRGGSFRGWLFKIARNRSYDELRYRQRRRTISLDRSNGENDDRKLLDRIQGEAFFPEEAVERREQADAINRLLDYLPEKHRQVLAMVDMHDLDYQEAADALGVPVGTVKSRLSRARIRFRALAVQNDFV